MEDKFLGWAGKVILGVKWQKCWGGKKFWVGAVQIIWNGILKSFLRVGCQKT